MKLETFLYNLHFDTDKIFPRDWQVDWEDAPLAYKLYRGLPEIPLTADVPFTLKGRDSHLKPNMREFGHFLWYAYGLTQYSQSALTEGTEEKAVTFAQSYRRFAPSGGALYPNELYVYLKLVDVPEGIYHYDVAHHRLILLREGNYDSYLSRSLGNSCDISDCFGTVFVSTMFWKNFYKYNNFSYRLQGLDAGVLMGQSLEVAKRMGFSTRVCYQFLDRALNHLIGLSEQDESIYAVIPLSIHPAINSGDNHKVVESVSAAELCRELPLLKHDYYNQSTRAVDYPILRELNEKSMFETTESFVKIKEDESENFSLSMETIMLPFTESLSYDFASICKERHSPDIDFILRKVSQTKLATLLQESTLPSTYQNDLDNIHGNSKPHVSLYGTFYNVEGVPDGSYSYDKSAHALRRISHGDYRQFLQYGLTLENVNLLQVPICLHIIGDRDHLKEKLGHRGYRVQQMEAGMLVQRLLLVATSLGMGGHPLLGFDVNSCDDLYMLPSIGKTCLIEIPIGSYRPRTWLKGSLHS